MNEIWKTTTINSDYEVSNMGNIRSNKRNKQRLLKPFSSSIKNQNERGGYLSVRLLENGEERNYPIHRLVAMAFIDNPYNLPQVNHKNGIKNDNRAENLEWCDNSYNIWHSYNILGNTSYTDRKVCQYTKDGELIKEWASAHEIEKVLGFNASYISIVCKKQGYRKTAYGFSWRFANDITNNKVEYNKTSPVVQISKYGEKLKTFNSVRDAALEVGVLDGGISGVCMKRKSGYNYAGGYLWRYVDDYNENEFGYYIDKTFIQMTMNNIFIAEYNGTHELVDKGGYDLVKVIMCCKGDRNSTSGCKWCVKEEGDKTRKTKREKVVVQLDKKMTYIAEYESAVIAAKSTNTHATHIGESCKSLLKSSCGGYYWLYKDDYINLKENK